jgi:hypothetical protein
VEPNEPAFKFQQRDNARIIDIVGFRAKITNSRNELEVSLPEPVTQMICQPDRERCDGKRWIGVATGRKYRTPGKVQILDPVRPAVFVYHAVAWIFRHSGGSDVVVDAVKLIVADG